MTRTRLALSALPAAVVMTVTCLSPALAAPDQTGQAGQRDPSFGTAGVVHDRFAHDFGMSFGSEQLRHADGRTTVLGDASTGPGLNPGLIRYLPDGSLDRSFGHEGKAMSAFGRKTSVESAGVVPTGRGGYLVAATRNTGTSEQPEYAVATIRYSQDGRLDVDYGKNGLAVLPLPSGAIARDLSTDSQGRALIAVSTSDQAGESGAVVRIDRAGKLDPTYGTGGVAALPADLGPMRVSQLALDSHDRAVVAGTAMRSEPGTEQTRQAVARLSADGAADTGFGDRGIANTEVADTNAGVALTVDDADRPLVGGYAIDGLTAKSDFSVVRYDDKGERDASFADTGIARFAVSSDDDTVTSLTTDSAGRIVAAGTRWSDMPESVSDEAVPGTPAAPRDVTMQERSGFELARLTEAGDLDNGFGTNGTVVDPLQTGAAAFDVSTSRDDSIQVVGFSFDQELTYFATTARYLP